MENKQSFEKDYWKTNYSEPELMDGIYNAREHAIYAKYFFKIEQFEVKSMIDFAFGYGSMLKAFNQRFKLYRCRGYDASEFIYEKVKKKKYFIEHPDIKLQVKTVQEVCRELDEKKVTYDLGLCTSLLQYVPDEDMDFILSVMAKRCRFLYFSVPIDVEYDRMKLDFNFEDPYAHKRSREYYREKLKKYFTFVGLRILESKTHFSLANTPMTDYLFRS